MRPVLTPAGATVVVGGRADLAGLGHGRLVDEQHLGGLVEVAGRVADDDLAPAGVPGRVEGRGDRRKSPAAPVPAELQ